MPPFKDISGQRFGRLVAVRRAENVGSRTMWLCRCDCGKDTTVVASALGRLTTSCGCARVTPIEERFCWEWQASRSVSGGYGQLASIKTGERPIHAHRFSWELHFGQIPAGLFVCHHCDNPPCVRPDHLFLGTVKDNYDDAAAKGRTKVPPRGTHCSRGHEYSIYQGRQVCWICRKEATQRRKQEAAS